MKHFRTSFSEVICGTINIPASIRIGLISDSKNVDYPLIHNRSVNLSSGLSFKTASSEITQDIIPDKYVIYCDKESGICGPWIVQNSIEVKVYETKNNTLLARKTIGSLDDISIMPSNDVYEYPSIVLEPCSSSPVNLKNSFIRIEFKSLCDSGSEPCCDHLPNNVSVSGYDFLCLPLDEFHVVPTHPPATTTPAPVIENRTIIDRQPTIKTSDDIDYYRVESDISIIGGSSFKYWWERKEDESGSWVRHTELQEAPSNTTVFIREPKERDYYYRLLLIEPNQMYSESVFFDFPDPTTTTTTTLPPPFFEPPDKVTSVEGSGAFRGVHLSWTPPAYDGNSDITGYHIIGKLPDNTKFPFQETTVVDTGVFSSVSGYFQPVPFQYDGVDILYCVYSMNYFGVKGAQDGGSSCVIASSKSNDPPTVFNLEITPFRTSSTRGYNLDWDVSSAPDLPLLSHIIKYRPSGSTEVYTTADYSELASNASITGDFLGCEMYEINVQGVNEIGESVAVTGYSLMNFPASAPTGISYTLLEGDSNEFVEMSGSWSAPADNGLCPISDYVFSYRLLPNGDFTDAINTNNGLTFKTSDTLPSGDYELRVAAITEFEVTENTQEGNTITIDSIYTTGVYGMYNPLTIFIYNFESWRVINENPNVDYTRSLTYPYFPSGYIITEDVGPRNIPATLICGNQNHSDNEGNPYDCYDGFETSKFGSSGLYLSENNFACPVDNYGAIAEYDDDGNNIGEEYINGWKYLMGPEINNIIKGEGGIVSDPIPLHKDEKTKLTFEFWFKLSGNYQSSWEEDPVYVADIVFAHTQDVANLGDGDAFRSSNGYDYVYDGTSSYSTDYVIFNSYDNYYERWAFSRFSIKGQYVPSLGFRLIYQDEHSMREVKHIASTAPIDAFPREIETTMSAASNAYNIAYPEETNEFTGRFSSHGFLLNNRDIPTNVYIDDADWHHIAISIDSEASNFVTMYYDGNEVFTHKPTINLSTEHDGTSNDMFHSYKTTAGVEYTYLGSGYDPLLAYGHFSLGAEHELAQEDSIENYEDTANCFHFDDVRLSASVVYDGEFDPPTSAHTS